jgi:hypothetical protein
VARVGGTERKRVARGGAQPVVAGRWADRARWAEACGAFRVEVVDDSWRSLSKALVPGRSRASYPPTTVRKVVGLSAGRVRQTSLPAELVDELSQLTQALEVEEVRSSDGRRGCQRVAGVVCRVQRHGGMAAIGQTDDDIRAAAVADTDHGQLLSAERMMGMRDGHESRRGLGRRGSALGMCPRYVIVSCRWRWR